MPVQLADADIRALAELLRMEDVRALDTALVSRLLSHSTAEVRARAALAAGRVGTPAATPLLLRALADSVASVRTRAAFAFGVLADSSAEVINALGRTALHDATAPAVEATGALGRIGAAAARPILDSIIEHPRHHAALRHEALIVAWRLPRDSTTIARLAVFTRHDDAVSRWSAAYSLARNGSPAAIPALLVFMTDADAQVRAIAARGLRVTHVDSAGERDAALPALLEAARDSHPHVRINALRQLPAYREPARTLPYLAELLTDDDENVAFAAAQALGEVPDRRAVIPLRDAATNGSRSHGVRTAALSSLIRVDSAAAGSIGLAWADSAGAGQWLLRRHAARSLAFVPWQSGAARLERLARDDHHLVAAEALVSIRTVADTQVATRRIYLEHLGAAHPLVRAAAARGLAAQAGPADLDVMLLSYDRARHDERPDAALAALEGLGVIAGSSVPVDRTFFLRFGAHGPPADERLYRAILEHVGAPPASWTARSAHTQPQQPLSHYEQLVRTYVAPVLAGADPPHVVISTLHGDIEIELASADAPLTVHNFVTLVERGYYNGTRWHRVVPNFVIQDGDPHGDGNGGPGYAIRDEINALRYRRGTLGMALSGPDTGGSQFFITHSPQPHLDGGYTVFGNVRSGDAVDRVVQEEPVTAMRIVR